MALDLRPAKLDIDAIVGNDLSIVVTVTDSAGAAVDLSAYTIQADVYAAGVSVATFGDSVGGASSNVITLTLTDAQTTTLGADSSSREWSLKVTNSGDTREWLAGRFRLYTVGAAGNTTTTAVALTAGSVSVSLSALGATGLTAHIATTHHVPTGGTTGQVLAKASATDRDTEWVTSGGVSDGDKGDITVSGSGAVWTIDAAAKAAIIADATNATQAELDAAVAAHEAAANPHPGYLTPAEGDAAYDAIGAAAAAQAASQPLDADLTTIGGLTPTNDDVLQRKAGAWANRTIAQLLTDLAAAGTTFQPLDSDLTALAALTTTAYGRAVLELADQAALMALLSAASDTAAGKVELATSAEVATGTDTARAVTPAGAAATYLPITGAYAVNTVAASGATETLTLAPAHKVTMDQNCTFTFPTPTAGHTFLLLLVGAFTPTFPASVDWDSGAAPTYATPSLYGFTTLDGGTTWLGSLIGSAYA